MRDGRRRFHLNMKGCGGAPHVRGLNEIDYFTSVCAAAVVKVRTGISVVPRHTRERRDRNGTPLITGSRVPTEKTVPESYFWALRFVWSRVERRFSVRVEPVPSPWWLSRVGVVWLDICVFVFVSTEKGRIHLEHRKINNEHDTLHLNWFFISPVKYLQ